MPYKLTSHNICCFSQSGEKIIHHKKVNSKNVTKDSWKMNCNIDVNYLIVAHKKI